MEIYIEYALMENFLFDGVLLFLALKAARAPVHWGRIALAALFGAGFAVVFPLLILPMPLKYAMKFSVGFLLCMLASKGIKTKKEWGRYAFTAVWFFVFSFGFGGVLLGIGEGIYGEKAPTAFVLIGGAVLTGFSLFFIKKLYAKRALSRFLYDCKVIGKKKSVCVSGFLDSGNLAMKNNIPVCFVSPDIIYQLWGEEILKCGGQVCDEIKIQTLGGEKRTPLYQGKIEVKTLRGVLEKEVYFAPSANILSREYKMIINSYLLDDNLM